MSTAREFALEIAERISGLGPVTVRRFFNGVGLVADEVQFAFVMGGSLYLKVDDEFRAAFEALGAKPFVYEGKRKAVTISSYYETPEDVLYDQDELRRWAVRSHRAAAAARLRREPKKKAAAPSKKQSAKAAPRRARRK
ncbi:MAG TPA: TfoX/Sxy family protein [Steroidobacter sp.]|uniref:TfoX/Sxy family protein n=1 Tax=Steroidobacter sp. TaxID=1978227 RepID=UPI002EDAA457